MHRQQRPFLLALHKRGSLPDMTSKEEWKTSAPAFIFQRRDKASRSVFHAAAGRPKAQIAPQPKVHTLAADYVRVLLSRPVNADARNSANCPLHHHELRLGYDNTLELLLLGQALSLQVGCHPRAGYHLSPSGSAALCGGHAQEVRLWLFRTVEGSSSKTCFPAQCHLW